jgi:hypothetical protein
MVSPLTTANGVRYSVLTLYNKPERAMAITCKQALYKTAIVAKPVWDIPAGTHVAVMYHGKVYNGVTKQIEEIYSIGKSHTEWIGHVYANTLTNFVL